MKKIFTTVLVALFAWAMATAQSCLPEGITFLAQEQIDDFPTNYPGCQVIEGDITIQEGFGYITDLSGLSNIHSVGGNVTITTDGLVNLQGLHNITTIGGTLNIDDNSHLLNLLALSNLTTINGDLIIKNNYDLIDLNGLSNLNHIGGKLKLYSNLSLNNITGLSNLTMIESDLEITAAKYLASLQGLHNIHSIGGKLIISGNESLVDLVSLSNLNILGGDLFIGSNNKLTNLTGLNNLSTIGDSVYIYTNKSLNSLSGLDNLHHIIGGLTISYNYKLKDVSSLSGLQSIGRDFFMTRSDSLTTLSGLDNVITIGGNLSVEYNASLTSLNALHQLQNINGYLIITDNPSITNLNGLDSLRSLNGGLAIKRNTVLNDLTSLSHLDSIGTNFEIWDNDSLITLVGLDNLRTIGGNFSIYDNGSLDNISGLANVEFVGDNLWIINNPSLTNCAIYAVCNQVFQRPEALDISGNASGCASSAEVEIACSDVPVLATVILDNNGNCQADATDARAEGVLVRLSATVQHSLRPTKTDGTVEFGYLDNGPFSLSLPQIPTDNWVICQDTLSFLPDTIQGDTIRATFFLQPLNQCPELTVELGLPAFFRGCLVNSFMQIATRNIGTINAEDVRLAVVMPDGLTLTSSIPAIAAQSGDTLFFDLGEVPPFQANIVNMVVKTTCDAVQEGKGLCLEAFATLSNPCPITAPPASEIRLFSECISDTTVRFTIKNVGDAATQNAHEYVIIEDEVILLNEDFSLDPLESLDVDVASTGSTYRMEATKYDDGTLTATALESCGGFTPGFITAYWLNDGLRDYDFDCREIRAAYDPNQKTAIPTGVGPEHLLAANKPIQYTIDFQNTGTDTAFRVQLLDILSPYLNVNTFRPGFSSHPYTWEIRGADTLEVLFYPITLPDSNVNEATSHGWFSFEIDQKPNLPDGTTIENTAAIVFDYNAPIVTNTVLHTIGKLTVSVDELQQPNASWQVLSNPTRYAAIFRAKEFVAGEKRFELTDAVGRVVRMEHFSGQEFEFRRGSLAGGLYYFRIMDARGKAFSGKIMVSE